MFVLNLTFQAKLKIHKRQIIGIINILSCLATGKRCIGLHQTELISGSHEIMGIVF